MNTKTKNNIKFWISLVITLIIFLLTMAYNAVNTAAAAAAETTRAYDELVNLMIKEIGLDDNGTLNLQIEESPLGFYDDFQVWEDYSFRFKKFDGCILSGLCNDDSERYEIADCTYIASKKTNHLGLQKYTTIQHDWRCDIGENVNGNWIDVIYPLTFVFIHTSDNENELIINVYMDDTTRSFLPMVTK
jgi:hypothetical protein